MLCYICNEPLPNESHGIVKCNNCHNNIIIEPTITEPYIITELSIDEKYKDLYKNFVNLSFQLENKTHQMSESLRITRNSSDSIKILIDERTKFISEKTELTSKTQSLLNQLKDIEKNKDEFATSELYRGIAIGVVLCALFISFLAVFLSVKV